MVKVPSVQLRLQGRVGASHGRMAIMRGDYRRSETASLCPDDLRYFSGANLSAFPRTTSCPAFLGMPTSFQIAGTSVWRVQDLHLIRMKR
jgi:hypothetical protein